MNFVKSELWVVFFLNGICTHLYLLPPVNFPSASLGPLICFDSSVLFTWYTLTIMAK